MRARLVKGSMTPSVVVIPSISANQENGRENGGTFLPAREWMSEQALHPNLYTAVGHKIQRLRFMEQIKV